MDEIKILNGVDDKGKYTVKCRITLASFDEFTEVCEELEDRVYEPSEIDVLKQEVSDLKAQLEALKNDAV